MEPGELMDTARLQLGTGSSAIPFLGTVLPMKLRQQTINAIRTGPETQREARQGITTFAINDLSGGFLPTGMTQDWTRDKNRIYKSEGAICHIPGHISLPFLTTIQTALAAVDVSAYRAARKRVHAINSALGALGLRYYAFLGPNMYEDTSLTNPALRAKVTADNITNNVLSVVEGRWSGVDGLAISTDNTTDDTKYTTDPTANDVTWSSLFAHASGDGFDAMVNLKHLGAGFMAYFGTHAAASTTSGIFFTRHAESALYQVVLKDTAHTPNGSTNNRTATAANYAASGTQNTAVGSATVRWVAPQNIGTIGTATAEDNNMVSVSGGAASTSTPYLIASGFGFNVPTGSIIESIRVIFDPFETNADDNAFFYNGVTLGVGGLYPVFAGTPSNIEVSPLATELPTTETDIDLFLLAPMEASDVNNGGFGFALRFGFDGAASTPDINIDSITAQVIYRQPGIHATVRRGGFHKGPNPANPSHVIYCQPARDEQSTYVQPNEAWSYLFEYDSDGDRLVVDPTKIAAQMPHVEDYDWYLGGAAMCGGSIAGDGHLMKLVDSNGVTRDMGFIPVHGTTPVKVVAIKSVGVCLLLWVANTASTDVQLWLYFNGQFYPYGVLFSKPLSGAMSTLPIPFAEHAVNQQQNYIYCFYPSSTNTAVARQFAPADLLSNVFLTNTSVVKHDGPLYTQGVRLNVLPEEAKKAILNGQYQNTQADNVGAGGAYGTVRTQINVAGDYAFAAAGVDVTFGDGTSSTTATYTDYNVVASNDPGVSYKTFMFKVILAHEAGTAKTPNGFPTTWNIASQFRPLRTLAIPLSLPNQTKAGEAWEAQPLEPLDFFERTQSLITTKVAQRFLGAGVDVPVTVDGIDFDWLKTTEGRQQPTWKDLKTAVIYVSETEGSTQ